MQLLPREADDFEAVGVMAEELMDFVMNVVHIPWKQLSSTQTLLEK